MTCSENHQHPEQDEDRLLRSRGPLHLVAGGAHLVHRPLEQPLGPRKLEGEHAEPGGNDEQAGARQREHGEPGQHHDDTGQDNPRPDEPAPLLVTASPFPDALDEPVTGEESASWPKRTQRRVVKTPCSMRFRRVHLRAPSDGLERLADFYAGRLGLDMAAGEQTGATIGETQLVFSGGPGEPFYHFALLVPGNRFDAALEWIGERAELLPDPASGEVVFDFDNWDALACYFHDPAGNIVELIAHRGIDESGAKGPLRASELLGVSELGLVGDKAELAAAFKRELGLELWDGEIADAARLAFVGEKGRTFILSSAGRGWLPTGRAAEQHPCDVVLSGAREGVVPLGASHYRIEAGA